MAAITLAVSMASVAFFGLGFKFKFFSIIVGRR